MKLSLPLLFMVLLVGIIVRAQPDSTDYNKLSPILRLEAVKKEPANLSDFLVHVQSPESFKRFLDSNHAIHLKYEYVPAKVFVIRTSLTQLFEKIIHRHEVLFIDEQRIPREEVAVSNLDLGTNRANMLHAYYPHYNAQGLTVSVKEQLPDTADIDFKGRYIQTGSASTVLSAHATIMTTMIGGAGNSYYEGKGVATGANLSSTNFSNLLPEAEAWYQQYNISVQNHSYGTGIENFYGADAMAYDVNVVNRPFQTHVFSAGNAGTQTSPTGPYSSISGYANLTGSFKMAKNILTVGHTDSFGIVLSPSSHGPAYDGRVKPELVAFGEDGSSGAAAIVSGIALTLQDRYKQQNGVLPSSALVKAVLLNSADDVSRKGIDFVSGYGAANAYKAMQSISHPLNVQSTVAHGAQQQFDFNLPANIRLLKVMLAWIDPPATANASKALRNDLDLELTLPATNESWLPWVLSHFPQRDSLEKLPVRKRDSLNNVEQITIENPAAGNYRLLVRGFNVPVSSPQSFAIAIMMDTMDLFKWQYPTHADNIFNNRYNTLRWASTFSASTGDLEYSLDQGVNWRMIQPAANLASNFIKWMPPDTFATALLRMRVGAQSFVSDTFTISNRLDVNVGFNCPDSFLLFWNSVPGVSSYSLYGLGSKYMDPVRTINDTAVILSKQSNPSLHYAIAPLLPLKTGVRSYAYNYTLQGVGCYIISFLSALNGNNAELQLNLGTLYRVNRIVLQKWNGSQFVDLQQVTSLPGLSISFSDNTLLQGLNRYRAVIFLTDGRMILSDITDLYFSSGLEYLIFPNPARATENLQVLAMEGTEDSRLVVFNSIGQKVYDKKIEERLTTIPISGLSTGVYFFRFIKNSGEVSMKVIISN